MMTTMITVNGKPLGEFLDKERNKEIDSVIRVQTRKYWKGKSRCRYEVPTGCSKARKYEDWEVFVYLLDKLDIDITDLEFDELHKRWRKWKKKREV